MSMTPSEDERVARILLGSPDRWRSQPEARQAAEVRAGLAQARATRAQSILTYLTADRSDWPAHVDQMLREELGIDDLPPAPAEITTWATVPEGTDDTVWEPVPERPADDTALAAAQARHDEERWDL